MTKEKKEAKKEESETIDIDFGIGRISFGGVFKGIGNLIDLASKLGEGEIKKTGEIKGLPKGAKGVYGFSLRTMGGKPIIETFGNIRDTARGAVVEEVREPMVDIFDEKDRILIVAEMPGVTEDKIKIEISGDILNLTASDAERKYAREILLPGKVKPGSMKTAYKNGILEITLEKAK